MDTNGYSGADCQSVLTRDRHSQAIGSTTTVPPVVSHGDTAMVVTVNVWERVGTQSLPIVISEMLDHHRDTAPPYRRPCHTVNKIGTGFVPITLGTEGV